MRAFTSTLFILAAGAVLSWGWCSVSFIHVPSLAEFLVATTWVAVTFLFGLALTFRIKSPFIAGSGHQFLNFLGLTLALYPVPEIWIPYGLLSLIILACAAAVVAPSRRTSAFVERGFFCSSFLALGMVAWVWIGSIQQEKRDSKLFFQLAGEWTVNSQFGQVKAISIRENGRISGSLRGQFHHWNEGTRTISLRTFGVDSSFDHGSHPLIISGNSIETFLPEFGRCVWTKRKSDAEI